MARTKIPGAGERTVLHVKVAGRGGTLRFARSFTIGRSDDNDLVIADPMVSQRHAELVLDGDQWRLRDLESTNGTVVRGEPIEEIPVNGRLRLRLGYGGPVITLTPEGAEQAAGDTAVQSESAVLRRFLTRSAPDDMGELTGILRRALTTVQRRHARRYLVALAVALLLVAAASGYAYFLHKEVARQKAAAQELFYTAKRLELELAELGSSAAERGTYEARMEELDQQYRDFIDELGIYSESTPREVQLVYRVAHRFGESEVNVPQEFVDEVLAYVEQWKTTPRLAEAIARAQQGDYGQRIADIMLEHGLPPDLFYLALQESDLRLDAVGPETRFGIAKGMWQLIPGTARQYGLQTGPLVGVPRPDPRDERHDFEKATRAAARYLRRIYDTDAQASGLLVAASYNWGQTRVLRLIRTLPKNPQERNFWQLLSRYREEIPQETYNYIFHIVSAAVIGEDPQLFGFEFEPPFQRPSPPPAPEELAE